MRQKPSHRGSPNRRSLNPRTNSRARGRRAPERSLITPGTVLGLSAVTAVFVAGVLITHWQPTGGAHEGTDRSSELHIAEAAPAQRRLRTAAEEPLENHTTTARFSKCGLVRRTCVVDGDTFWLDGEKVRVADIDTPEVSQPRCAAERALGDRATNRLVTLLNEGPFELAKVGDKDKDQFGRKLRVVLRSGHSLGDQLVAEGLARSWTGRREPWC